ncbi:MAG: M1 family metallopeptidase, partial [Flavisolibacter sp.]
PVARKIFGTTPAMITLFSKLTGVDYPWVKYAQMVARDYVSGAMENTTATLHQETAQQDARELTDGNRWEDIIAHELFHQWFGDYVTTESWSNISLNESFATIGSQLWNEFYYGKDKGDEERYNSIQGYMGSRSEEKDLVRFHYRDKEDVFDAVSYNKGGSILQMLRAFVGDSAFFKAINLYLTTNKFKAAEAHQLRLAFEEVTGKDLNWFFNQWYFGSGHPVLDITYKYNDATKQQHVIVSQTGNKVFTIPVKIDVWSATGAPKQYTVWAKNKVDTFSFAAPVQPVFVNFDADKKLIAQKTENKTLEDYLFQYKNARNYVDRREAIAAAMKKQEEVNAVQILALALKDPYGPLRMYTVNGLDISLGQVKNAVETSLTDIAQKDKHRLAKAAAIAKLGNYKLAKYAPIFKTAVNDSSYTVSGFALEALSKVDSLGAATEAKRLSAIPAKGKLASTIKKVMAGGDAASGTKLVADFEALPMGQEKFQALQGLFELIESTTALDVLKKAVDAIMKLQTQIPEAFRDQVNTQLNAGLKEIAGEKAKSGLKDQSDYIESKLPKDEKKGF